MVLHNQIVNVLQHHRGFVVGQFVDLGCEIRVNEHGPPFRQWVCADDRVGGFQGFTDVEWGAAVRADFDPGGSGEGVEVLGSVGGG
jgi:hypothetical protein